MADYSYNSEFVRNFDKNLTALINEENTIFDMQVFNKMALEEFAIQYHNIEYLQQLCREMNLKPESITSWEQVPVVPSALFKERIIATFPLHETELTIMTSGTSSPNSPSKIYRDKRCVDMCYLANRVMTKKYLFPDIDRMKILLMVPSPKLAPSMGMAVGLEQLRQNFGTEESKYLITPNGMEWELLFDALHNAEETGVPVAIIGATSGLVFLYNFCRDQGLRFKLPPGSRVCDGGGYMGTFGDCSKEEYLNLCGEILGVPAEYCVNTLGSGECATNYFDNVLRNHYLGIKGVPRYKECPPWAKTVVVHPVTGERLPKGEKGLICHYDLVNRANLFAVKTNNLGYEAEDGFEIIGRSDSMGKASHTILNRMISGQGEVSSTVADNVLSGQTCSTVADNMLSGQTCSTVADNMLSGQTCSTVADNMLSGQTCSTVADDMLGGQTCSTVADDMLGGQTCNQKAASVSTDELLAASPHGNMFGNVSVKRLEKLKRLCPFLRLQGLIKKGQREH